MRRIKAEEGWQCEYEHQRVGTGFLGAQPVGFQNPDGAGFEPAVPFGTHAFQACPIDRSGTHPAEVRLWIQMEAGANEIAEQ